MYSFGTVKMQSTMRENKVFVDKPNLLEDIIDRSFYQPLPAKVKSSDIISLASTATTASKLLKEQQLMQNLQTESAMKHNVLKALEISRDRQEKQFPKLLAGVHKAQLFLDTIDKDINLFDEARKNKSRRQFEEWNENVHGDIQKRIAQSVNAMDTKELNKKKNQDYNNFLSITNRKPAIFRDIIIESEYDPLEPNRHCIKAKTGRLKDPVNIDAQKAETEGAMLVGGNENRKKKTKAILGKETLPVELWASGKIEATPYGSFAKMMSNNNNSATRSSSNPTVQQHHSKVIFDHYQYPHGKAAIDVEMPRGKRIYPKTIYADPRKVFNVLPSVTQNEIAAIRPPENLSWTNEN